MALKAIRALVLDSSALGSEVINRGGGALQGMRGINYVIMIRVCDHIEEAKAACYLN